MLFACLDISSAYFSTFSFSFISNQMIYTMSSGRMHGSSQPSGKFCLTLSCVLSAFFGHHLKVQHGKNPPSLPAFFTACKSKLSFFFYVFCPYTSFVYHCYFFFVTDMLTVMTGVMSLIEMRLL